MSEDTVRLISAKKNEPEWMLEFRLKAYRHWLTMKEPKWPNIHYPQIDFQDIIYYCAPKQKAKLDEPGRSRSGAAAHVREARHSAERASTLAGVAVDAVFDWVSVATTYKEKLKKSA